MQALDDDVILHVEKVGVVLKYLSGRAVDRLLKNMNCYAIVQVNESSSGVR